MDDHFHCLDGENSQSSIRDESIKISDVIEVIETDTDFPQQQQSLSTQVDVNRPPTTPAPMQQQDPVAGPSSGACRRPPHLHHGAAVRIVEQPAAKALRFRYECEGRSAGSIPGANSTPESKTFPAIRIEGYQGRAVVVVSCVTKDPPYRPHPHNLVGREGCKKGVCTLEVSPDTMTVQFSNLGIQCIKKKEIESALKTREEIRVDPFRTGFSHRSQPTSIDLNAVRLAFQVFLQNEKSKGFTHPISPIVSEPIYDKKAMTDLNIIKLSDCNSPVDGGHKDIILLCEKVAKEDIQVRFYEETDGVIVWEAFGDFQPSQVHKQTAIWFRTPRYRTLDITDPVRVNIQLRRPSDGATSVPLPFEMLPLDAGRPAFWSARRRTKTDYNLFSAILANDPALCNAAKRKREEIIANSKPEVVEVEVEVVDDEPPQVEKTLSDLIREVSELDEIYEDNQKRINEIDELEVASSMQPQESFDDSKTYSSLQMAFKNPVEVVDIDISDKYEDVIVNPIAPIIDIGRKESLKEIVATPESLPPLPPKRAKKVIETYIGLDDYLPQQENISFSTTEPSNILKNGSPYNSQQILTVAPIPLSRSNSLHSAPPLPDRKLPPLPIGINTLPNPKKRGFFSKIFGKKQPKSGPTSLRNSVSDSQALHHVGLNRTPSIHSKVSTPTLDSPVHTNASVDNVSIRNNNNFPIELNDKDADVDPELLETDDFNMNLDLTEAEHYALYTAVAPRATESEFDETSCYYAPVEGGRLLTNAEFMNRINGNIEKDV